MSQMRAGGPADLSAIRKRLEGLGGRRYWRSLEDVVRTPEFREALEREFPARAAEWNDDLGRRGFLRLMGASMALAGLTACTRQPKEVIAPHATAPEGMIPGVPVYYATALTLGGRARGALVETHEGRPTKVEGNPEHPFSLGAADVFMQAAILGLYDPDRSRTVTHQGEIRPWGDLVEVIQAALEAQSEYGGAGLRILTESITSPTLASQIEVILERFPAARWHQYEPVHRDNSLEGARLAFGRAVEARYDLEKADAVLSLEHDFVYPSARSLRDIRHFTARRRMEDGRPMNRLYVVESFPSGAGAVADHRLRMRSSRIESLARRLAARVGLPVAEGSGAEEHHDWIDAVARDLESRGGASLVIAGESQPPLVHALCHAINERLGGVGRTVVYAPPAEARPESLVDSIRSLADDMERGDVGLLLILGGNPAHTAPADIPFAGLLEKVGLSVHLGLYEDETSARCHWHVPMAHELESWGDARAEDGTVSVIQPMIQPLHGGRTAHEILALLHEKAGASAHTLVRDHWKASRQGEPDFEGWWMRALHDGLIAGSAFEPVDLHPETGWMSRPAAPASDGIELVFRPDASVYDGRYVNNGWLQELPRPVTRLAWDNAALISPRTAERLGLSGEQTIELRHPDRPGRVVAAPVWIAPGQADDTVTVHLGYGHGRAGVVGSGTGFDAYPLRRSGSQWFATVTLAGTPGRSPLVSSQDHHSMQGRELVRSADVDHFREHPDFARHASHEPAPETTLYREFTYEGHAWGMVIDLNSCVGCNACVVGCQSENNIPVVGKDEMANGREMHWIRVDRYFEGELDDPTIWHQPVPCMHCENAPCEPVCPVGATVHSSEGLNDMVYNRCVGTRYCSNNCPYKVRRFNFYLYSDFETPSRKLMNNPDVTVRSRGVMEKCTYCVQRINKARIEAHKEDRPIRDGEIVTACQQACPAQAITFGDINDETSRVSRLKADPRNYGLLTDLNTRPRTTYLAALRNPNPDLVEG